MFDFNAARKRSELFMAIRRFFTEKDFLEVSTPTLSPYLIPEPSIKVFRTDFMNEFKGHLPLYLIPSPEIFMKKLLAAGSGSIFQISQCFRNAEQLGDVHNPEFTMLEYYAVDADEKDSIELTIEMIERTKLASCPAWIDEKPLIITMAEAMYKYAGVDMDKAENISYLRKEAERLSLTPAPDEPWDDTFNRIFLTYTEPSLPQDREVYLTEYPDRIRCLAAKDNDKPVRKRWEMYIDGVEVANCYDEETDKGKIKGYYVKEYEKMEKERKGTDDVIPAVDMAFADLEMKKSSGVAIGLDRLLMTSLSLTEIRPLLSFPLSDMLTQDN